MRDATRLDIYFRDDRALFLIPLYQRKYAWQQKHCQRLFSDLQKIQKENIRSHFFGSIVSVKADSEHENDLLIIDGQQRITTISILILAAINAVKNGEMIIENEEFLKDTMEKYLYAKYRRHVERKIKLHMMRFSPMTQNNLSLPRNPELRRIICFSITSLLAKAILWCLRT